MAGPAGVAGCLGWWKADSLGLSDGAAVTSWPDSSGSGPTLSSTINAAGGGPTHTAPTFKTGILNGKPVVRFNGIGDYLTVGGSAPVTGMKMFFIVATTSEATFGDYRGLFCGDVNGVTTDFWALGSSGATSFYSAAVTDLTYYKHGIADMTAGSGTTPAPMSGAFDYMSFASAQFTSPGYPMMGLAEFGSTRVWEGDITEAICYDSQLGTTDRQTIEAYLVAKYFTGGGSTTVSSGGGVTVGSTPSATVNEAASTTGNVTLTNTVAAIDDAAGATTGNVTVTSSPAATSIETVSAPATVAAGSSPSAINQPSLSAPGLVTVTNTVAAADSGTFGTLASVTATSAPTANDQANVGSSGTVTAGSTPSAVRELIVSAGAGITITASATAFDQSAVSASGNVTATASATLGGVDTVTNGSTVTVGSSASATDQSAVSGGAAVTAGAAAAGTRFVPVTVGALVTASTLAALASLLNAGAVVVATSIVAAIDPDSLAPTPAERITRIPAEARLYLVGPESRTAVIAAESRTYAAQEAP